MGKRNGLPVETTKLTGRQAERGSGSQSDTMHPGLTRGSSARKHALAQGLTVTPEESGEGLTPFADAIAAFLEDVKLSKKPKTFAAYGTTLGYFGEIRCEILIETGLIIAH
jgi:hypothetical protein